jgi:hypothetical protein
VQLLLTGRPPAPAGDTGRQANQDGALRQLTLHTWRRTLAGYTVIVSDAGGWHHAVIGPKGYTAVCRPATSPLASS